MLEYYTMDADYLDSLVLTEELFAELLQRTVQFDRVTVAEAFGRWAGFDLFDAAEKKGVMEAQARRLGLDPMPGLDIPALYDLIFIHAVEPKLKAQGLTALLDYPAFVPCLARKNGKTTERWELYAEGIELANCFSEETDPQEVRVFFEHESSAKESSALVRHLVDSEFWKIFRGFPRCSGTALGLDRLVMLVTGKSSIDAVLPFPDSG
jgi:lysyl-tRNA synthetase class 2